MTHRPQMAASDSAEWSWNTERRAAVRYPCQIVVTCRLAAAVQAEPWFAEAHNLSTLGAGLRLAEPVEWGNLLLLELRTPDGLQARTVPARVVHVEQEADGIWLAGVAFIAALGRDELRLYGADAVPSADSDHRRWVRFACDVETVCYTCATVPGERRPARVLDVSAGGVGLLIGCEFPVGTILRFELPGRPGQPGLRRRIRVVRAQEHRTGNWLTGCEFTDELRNEELRAFLGLS